MRRGERGSTSGAGVTADRTVRDGVRRQAGRRAGLRWSFPPVPVFREGVNILLARTEEIQKIHAHVFAGLANAQEDQVFLNALRCG